MRAAVIFLAAVACAAAEVDFNDPNAGAPVYDDDVWAPGIGVEVTPENYDSVVLDEKVDVLLYVFTPGFVFYVFDSPCRFALTHYYVV